jgi:hypothetical protein
MAIHLTGINPCEFKKKLVTLNCMHNLIYLSFFLVIAFQVHFTGHAEISHFDNSIIG